MRNKAKYAALGLLAAVSAVLLNGARSESPTYKWKSPANLHTVRAGACSALLPDGSVLITGGKGADGPLATTERFNGYESVEAAPMSHARADHACVALNDGRVLVAGGVTSGEAATNAVEVFDPETRAWTLAGSMTAARSAAASAGRWPREGRAQALARRSSRAGPSFGSA